jgi:hypothetical protein
MPLRPSRTLAEKSSSPNPIGLTTPIPVITTFRSEFAGPAMGSKWLRPGAFASTEGQWPRELSAIYPRMNRRL